MELEVIVQGKGSVTVKQEMDWTRKEIEKLTAHSFELINGCPTGREPFGFEGGTQVQAENAASGIVPPPRVDARAT